MNALAAHSRDYPDLERLRHSTAHVMAQAVTETFPGAKLGIGPAIADGFYYDFELPCAIAPEDLGSIESRMREIIAKDHRFIRREIGPDQARARFRDQPYKLEILDRLEAEGKAISTCRQDGFEDLCRGPHVQSTGEIPGDAFRLTHVSGAYWRGDESRPMLQRIYGTAWASREDLEQHLCQIEEARLRDHRKLGKALDLFSISEAVGPGLVLWHPKGAAVRLAMEDFMRRAVSQSGYQRVFTPHIGRATLWETSGHLDFFRDDMYAPMEIDGESYYVKPMSCPFHAEIFKSRLRSYRELPLRLAEDGAVYRYERSGVLHGMARPRGFTQDDAHIFCRPDQVDGEVEGALHLALSVVRAFGIADFRAELSTRPEKAVGADADWVRATDALRRAVEREEIPYSLDEGGGAFYGPKVSLLLRDAIGREWQCGTIQFDFNLPQRFGLEYTGEDGQRHRPIMVHRALVGSLERFFAVLIEHHAGAFPLWLAPVQAVMIPVSDRHAKYAEEVARELQAAGLRSEVDAGSDRMQASIRRAQMQKVPYMLIVGDREREGRTVSVRQRSGENLRAMSVERFLEHVRDELEPVFPPKRNDAGHGEVWNSRCC